MEKVTVNAVFLLELNSKEDWIRKLPRSLPKLAKGEEYLFIDSEGNFLALGEDFYDAEEIKTYPVKIYATYRTVDARRALDNAKALDERLNPEK